MTDKALIAMAFAILARDQLKQQVAEAMDEAHFENIDMVPQFEKGIKRENSNKFKPQYNRKIK